MHVRRFDVTDTLEKKIWKLNMGGLSVARDKLSIFNTNSIGELSVFDTRLLCLSIFLTISLERDTQDQITPPVLLPSPSFCNVGFDGYA